MYKINLKSYTNYSNFQTLIINKKINNQKIKSKNKSENIVTINIHQLKQTTQ